MMRPLADHGRYPHAPWQSRHAGGGCGFSASAVLCSTLLTRTAWGLKRWRLDAAPFFRLARHASSRPATNAHTPSHRARCIALMHSLTRACPHAPGAPRCTRQQADTAWLASGHCLFPRENRPPLQRDRARCRSLTRDERNAPSCNNSATCRAVALANDNVLQAPSPARQTSRALTSTGPSIAPAPTRCV